MSIKDDDMSRWPVVLVFVCLLAGQIRLAAGQESTSSSRDGAVGAGVKTGESTADEPQTPAASLPEPTRSLDILILIQSRPDHRIAAQEWGRVFQELGFSPRFRQPRPGETMLVEDSELDDKPIVRLVGGLAADGALVLADRKFTQTELKPLGELLQNFQRYGAGGPPESNPTWGLTDEQLGGLMAKLSESCHGPVTLDTAVLTLDALELPDGMRLTFTPAARDLALGRRPESAPESIDLTGFSRGTGLAIVLAQYGLGFRPVVSDAGTCNIEIDRGDETSNLWPVGWKTQEATVDVLPAWLKSIPIDLDEVEIDTVTQVLADRLEIGHFTSHHALAAAGLDPAVLTYTHRNARVSPFRLTTSMGDKLGLGFDLRTDEAGHLFLWLTTEEQSNAFRKRFAHIRPPRDAER
jgi:hypothetical protein